ncbi:outer membrane protein assembly factor BamA [Rhodocyclus tenuis]|uniref:Outer membrane protein assembly factor BamA n=1 Tax=Rhodocyclus tenuis TaxID=1066 RepID=A0A840G6N4_RHOTE|nr:outer membrane protein assembly factor BamA [Rhodocyclus tenuis]MBB4247071.1 outer membrane protein insertion porin family [Rhodocyclus tenuis]
MKKNLLAGLIAAVFASGASAFEAFTVKDIRVEGIQRTEAGTVFSYLPVKVGETMTDEKAAQAIKALFATGFFKDVRLEIDNDVIIVLLEERPAIAQIDFVGLKEFDKDQLKKGLKDVGIAESRIFDRATLEKAEQELKRQYLSRGKYSVAITTTVTPLERNRVSINFGIDEGEAAKIKEINIVGAKAFRDKELLEIFQLQPPNWISWYTKNDQYSKQKLSADLEALRSFYLNRGYLEFNIESTQVSISPDKKDIYITVSLSEGDRYVVSSVKLAGDLLLPEADFRKAMRVKPGDVFSREKLNESTKAISDRLGALGYAFANVNAAPEVDKEKRQVAFTIFVDPGKRAYVRRINVVGNTKTRDEVVRQEMRQMEGAWYDADRVTLSRQRIDKTNYFSEVSVETPPVPGTTDQVDVNVKVAEKSTGNISLGAGFGSGQGLILSGSIAQANLFGSGKFVSVQLNTSKIYRTIGLSYTNPYFTVDGISQGFDVYHRTMTPSSSYSYLTYKTQSTGGGIRFGYPIAEKESLSFGLGIDSTTVTVFPDVAANNGTVVPARYQKFVNDYGDGTSATNMTLPATVSWAADSKDSAIYPTSGGVRRAGLEVAIPGGSLKYYRATAQIQQYFPINKSLTLMLNGELGYADAFGGKDMPFYKRFYAGGVGSVRGYDTASLGPVDTTATDQRLGGNTRAVFNAELLFPIPGFGVDKSVRVGTFFDAGQVWDKDDQKALSDLRASAGLAAVWTSPFGPLKFSIAQPFNTKEGDKLQRFQFQMGTTF